MVDQFLLQTNYFQQLKALVIDYHIIEPRQITNGLFKKGFVLKFEFESCNRFPAVTSNDTSNKTLKSHDPSKYDCVIHYQNIYVCVSDFKKNKVLKRT